ncbi:hypothetical protein ACRALDRAFT_1092870 [Sodiomyces alcalophilus JCM 7366]|uniref:uncharacterized protein n=1 Tax=Sodiomyces alcalophilus JCM 7366 TaxID=591952 RepID=UPI0039B65021
MMIWDVKPLHGLTDYFVTPNIGERGAGCIAQGSLELAIPEHDMDDKFRAASSQPRVMASPSSVSASRHDYEGMSYPQPRDLICPVNPDAKVPLVVALEGKSYDDMHLLAPRHRLVFQLLVSIQLLLLCVLVLIIDCDNEYKKGGSTEYLDTLLHSCVLPAKQTAYNVHCTVDIFVPFMGQMGLDGVQGIVPPETTVWRVDR